MIALDASALLALLKREPGHEFVAAHLGRAVMSVVNHAEVLSRFARDGHDVAAIAKVIAGVAVELVPMTARDAELVAMLIPKTRAFGLSLGDRVCVALALSRSIPVLTADHGWRGLDLPVEIRFLPDRARGRNA